MKLSERRVHIVSGYAEERRNGAAPCLNLPESLLEMWEITTVTTGNESVCRGREIEESNL